MGSWGGSGVELEIKRLGLIWLDCSGVSEGNFYVVSSTSQLSCDELDGDLAKSF